MTGVFASKGDEWEYILPWMPRDPVGLSLVSIQKLLADYYLENLKIHILEFLEAWQTFTNLHPYFPNLLW